MDLLNFFSLMLFSFFLSFLKLFVLIYKKLVRLQRMFLWGGVKGESIFPSLNGMML